MVKFKTVLLSAKTAEQSSSEKIMNIVKVEVEPSLKSNSTYLNVTLKKSVY